MTAPVAKSSYFNLFIYKYVYLHAMQTEYFKVHITNKMSGIIFVLNLFERPISI